MFSETSSDFALLSISIKSVDFSSSNAFPVVSDAKVWLLDENRDTIAFTYNDSKKSYLPNNGNLVAQNGKTYQLQFLLGNVIYESSMQEFKKVPDFYRFGAYRQFENPDVPNTPYDDILFFVSLLFQRYCLTNRFRVQVSI